jgi:hypothetical protein
MVSGVAGAEMSERKPQHQGRAQAAGERPRASVGGLERASVLAWAISFSEPQFVHL